MSFFHELRLFSCELTHKKNFWAEWGSPCQVQHILHKVHISDLNPCGNPTRILMPSRCRSNAVVPLCCLEVLWRKSFFLMFYRHKRWHPCFSLNEVDAFTVLGVWWLPYQSLHRNYGLECFIFGVGLPRAPRSKVTCSVLPQFGNQSSTNWLAFIWPVSTLQIPPQDHKNLSFRRVWKAPRSDLFQSHLSTLTFSSRNIHINNVHYTSRSSQPYDTLPDSCHDSSLLSFGISWSTSTGRSRTAARVARETSGFGVLLQWPKGKSHDDHFSLFRCVWPNVWQTSEDLRWNGNCNPRQFGVLTRFVWWRTDLSWLLGQQISRTEIKVVLSQDALPHSISIWLGQAGSKDSSTGGFLLFFHPYVYLRFLFWWLSRCQSKFNRIIPWSCWIPSIFDRRPSAVLASFWKGHSVHIFWSQRFWFWMPTRVL